MSSYSNRASSLANSFSGNITSGVNSALNSFENFANSFSTSIASAAKDASNCESTKQCKDRAQELYDEAKKYGTSSQAAELKSKIDTAVCGNVKGTLLTEKIDYKACFEDQYCGSSQKQTGLYDLKYTCSPPAAAVGGAAAFVVILLIVIVCCCCCKKKKGD
jgi:hypothetical protein